MTTNTRIQSRIQFYMGDLVNHRIEARYRELISDRGEDPDELIEIPDDTDDFDDTIHGYGIFLEGDDLVSDVYETHQAATWHLYNDVDTETGELQFIYNGSTYPYVVREVYGKDL